MKATASILTALMLLLAGSAMGSVLVFESFEDAGMLGSRYYDYGSAEEDHDLVNNVGEAWVDGPGFDAWYYNTLDGVGLTDGDYVGVTDYTGTVGTFYDGVQGYQLSDTDGTMTLYFDEVPGAESVSIAVFVQSTGWEDADAIVITYGDVTLLDTTGQDIDDLGLEDMWTVFDSAVSGGQLAVSLTCNSGSEAIFIDAVTIEGSVATEEGSWSQVKSLY